MSRTAKFIIGALWFIGMTAAGAIAVAHWLEIWIQ